MLKITDTIYLVPGNNRGLFPYCNCVYIKDEVCALIDSAAGKDALAPLAGRVDILLNSHFHADHIRGNGMFPKAQVFCHEEDKLPILSRQEFLKFTGFDSFTPEQAQPIFANAGYRESRVDGTFLDGEIFDFGRTKLRVIHTPGHSPGHCCFYEEKSGLLIGADIDLTSFGPWYAHERSDLDAFEKSILKVMNLDAGHFLSGHGEGYFADNIERRLTDYAAFFAGRDRAILAALKEPRSLDELVGKKLIYPRYREPLYLFLFFEKNILQKHLSRLKEMGKITNSHGKFTAL
ncbi:MAG: MBL fold metallo-hydrolase [Dethiobacter sp.]|jgi:glyoxylase-like metal-dependent hydrolase (beta-lactamase superfamily II)|nr:MBL fold metallo-hydrolase [Dethiobacter sp.]